VIDEGDQVDDDSTEDTGDTGSTTTETDDGTEVEEEVSETQIIADSGVGDFTFVWDPAQY